MTEADLARHLRELSAELNNLPWSTSTEEILARLADKLERAAETQQRAEVPL